MKADDSTLDEQWLEAVNDTEQRLRRFNVVKKVTESEKQLKDAGRHDLIEDRFKYLRKEFKSEDFPTYVPDITKKWIVDGTQAPWSKIAGRWLAPRGWRTYAQLGPEAQQRARQALGKFEFEPGDESAATDPEEHFDETHAHEVGHLQDVNVRVLGAGPAVTAWRNRNKTLRLASHNESATADDQGTPEAAPNGFALRAPTALSAEERKKAEKKLAEQQREARSQAKKKARANARSNKVLRGEYLNVPGDYWTDYINQGWMQGGYDRGATFRLVTDVPRDFARLHNAAVHTGDWERYESQMTDRARRRNLRDFWHTSQERRTFFAQELVDAARAGYVIHRDKYAGQSLMPRVRSQMLEEIRQYRAKKRRASTQDATSVHQAPRTNSI